MATEDPPRSNQAIPGSASAAPKRAGVFSPDQEVKVHKKHTLSLPNFRESLGSQLSIGRGNLSPV